MIDDNLTVILKERKERSNQKEDRRGSLAALVFTVICFGTLAIYPPLALGPVWIESPVSLACSIIVPLLVVGLSIADSFAGERERTTLGTRLASRLPDRAILYGKLAAPILDAVQVTLIVHLVGLTVLNLAFWQGEVLFYPLPLVLANLGICFLLALYAASLGVLVSMRSASVQDATQKLMVVLIAPLTITGMIIILIGTVLTESWRASFETFFVQVILLADLEQIIGFFIGILLLVDLGLLSAVQTRFQQTRLDY